TCQSMGFLLWSLLVLVLPLPVHPYHAPSPLDSNCLYRRSRCLHDTPCRLRLVEFDSICGVSSTECLASSPSDCVNLLWQMKHWLGDDRCHCHPLFGASRECSRFGHLLYEHPCETLLKREPDGEEYRLIGVTREYSKRRTTRSPSSVQINEWKKQLSGDLFSLPTSTQLQSQECDVALHQICLRHVSCSQLWNLFRKNCVVDSDNTCIMQQREACWESFEGLLWTGLGRCHCSSNVSDCHWIRLHTNFNKCIYEISRSSGMPFSSFSPLAPPTPPPTQRVSFVNFASQSLSTHSPIFTTTSPLPTVSYSPPQIPSATESASIPTITIPRPSQIPHSSQRTVNEMRQEDPPGGGIHSNHNIPHPHHPTPIDPLQSHPGYRTPSQSSTRTDDRPEMRVNSYQHHTHHPPSPLNTQSMSSSDRVHPSPYQGHPSASTSQTVYSNPLTDQARHDYRSQGEIDESSRPSHPNGQYNMRRLNEWNGTHAGDPSRRREWDSRDLQLNSHASATQEKERANIQWNHSRQHTDRWNRTNYSIQSTTSRPEYGRSKNEDGLNRQENGREEQRGLQTNRRQEERINDRRGNGYESGRGTIEREGRREESRRQDSRLGKITQSNGREERGRGRVNRVNEREESPQQISVVMNEERSRDEYQISSDLSPSHYNPTIITASPAVRAKGMEEEKRKWKEEEERRQREEKREREREERRKMDENRKKEEEDRRQRERTEKVRFEKEEKKIEEKMRRKEKDEKKKEKLRQEKLGISRGGDDSDSSVAVSSSCLSALRECESVQECKFQLAELKTRCRMNCDRRMCQGALRRFSSFVPLPLSMALQFCSCPNEAETCPENVSQHDHLRLV
ncbi:hypothetical protein PMAYCL1PPCAC_18510, partial [Pristionchus mayeri]